MNITIDLFKNFFNNIYFVSVFAFISILFFFSFIFIGLHFTDTFYHLNQAQYPPNGVILYPILLSSLIIKGIIEIFGPHLIDLRAINAFIYIISLLMPFFFLKTRVSNIEKLFYIGCVIILIAPLNANILGYDTLSILINSLIFSITLLYLKKKKIYLLVMLAIFCSMSILIRLPNVLALPILIFVIIFQEKLVSTKSNLSLIKMPLLFLFLSLVGVFMGYFLYYGDWDLFRNASLGTISHDFNIIFYRYFQDGIKLTIFFFFILGTYFLFRHLLPMKGKFFTYGLILLLYILFARLFLFSGYSYAIFLTAMVLNIVVNNLFGNSARNNISHTMVCIVFTLFFFINAFGSNVGLLKTSFSFLLLPFVLSAVPVKSIQFWKFLLIIFIPFAVFGKFYRTYEDGNFFSLNKTLNIELLHPIKTTKERFVFLNDVDQIVKQLQNEKVKVFFYGNKSHIFHYLYPNTSLEIMAFNQPMEYLMFFPQIESKVMDREKIAVFLIDSYPESNEKPENLIEKKLMNRGFKKNQKGSVEFLIKTD